MSIIATPIVDGGINLYGFTIPAERAFHGMAASGIELASAPRTSSGRQTVLT